MVAKVSPSCVKKTANISISLCDLFCEILQAKVEIKVTNSQVPILYPPILVYEEKNN